eukprot:4796372-Alexandrium_andersonii.AAC.1
MDIPPPPPVDVARFGFVESTAEIPGGDGQSSTPPDRQPETYGVAAILDGRSGAGAAEPSLED